MSLRVSKTPVVAALGAAAVATSVGIATAAKIAGKYVAGDFHNHTTCSDGSISMQKLVKKSTDKRDTPWGLDWFVQAGHGGSGNRNCTLVEDATPGDARLPVHSTPTARRSWARPRRGRTRNPRVTKGNVSGTRARTRTCGAGSRCRSSSTRCSSTSRPQERAAVPGRRDGRRRATSTPRCRSSRARCRLRSTRSRCRRRRATRRSATPTALAQWEYCFDRGDTDTSRGNAAVGSVVGNNWNCAVPGSPNAADPSWNATAQKLIPAGGTGTGDRGHIKTLEAMKWMAHSIPTAATTCPPTSSAPGRSIRTATTASTSSTCATSTTRRPTVAFGFETQPGHGASDNRGEYRSAATTSAACQPTPSAARPTAAPASTARRSAACGTRCSAKAATGGSSPAPTGTTAAASVRTIAARRRTSTPASTSATTCWSATASDADKLRPQTIVDGLRTRQQLRVDSGQLIDRLAFVACASTTHATPIADADATRSSKRSPSRPLRTTPTSTATVAPRWARSSSVRPGADIVVAIVVRDPAGTNYSPYTFANPSLAQVGINQPLNTPVLDHIDVIRGMVTGYKTPGAPDYAGEWPSDWLDNPEHGQRAGRPPRTRAPRSSDVQRGDLAHASRRRASSR